MLEIKTSESVVLRIYITELWEKANRCLLAFQVFVTIYLTWFNELVWMNEIKLDFAYKKIEKKKTDGFISI